MAHFQPEQPIWQLRTYVPVRMLCSQNYCLEATKGSLLNTKERRSLTLNMCIVTFEREPTTTVFMSSNYVCVNIVHFTLSSYLVYSCGYSKGTAESHEQSHCV